MTKITDWIDATNGLRYGYDDGGRLTSITDYDDSSLTYAYDAAGNVTSMTDYHGNTTTYTYTNRNELSTLTAPGSKTWTFHYNDIGQPSYYNIPNGMTTNYTYDTLNRLTAIEHKDGTTVLDGFYYDLDAVGNITSTTHEDGAFWDYAYDGRYRLTSAVRSNPNETVEAAYSYTYDAGDNLLTKVEPFEDDFNDGNATGWTVTSGTWQASGNYLEPTHASNWNGIKQSTTDADNEVRLRYRINDTSNGSAALVVRGRYVDDNNLVQVVVRPGSVALEQIASGTPATLDSESAASTQDAWYNLRIESDGADVMVWRWADGELETKVLDTASASVTTANAVMLGADAAFAVDFDDIRILADGLSNTTTFAVNNANELTSMADRNGSTTFGFDAWGRMTSKARGSYTAGYGYNYRSRMQSVTTDFPEETDVTFDYDGNLQRRERTANGVTTQFLRGAGGLVNEEDGAGSLTRTYINMLADVPGSSPSTGAYRFYSLDRIRSTRAVRLQDRSGIGEYEFTPFGSTYSFSGSSEAIRYARLRWDDDAKMHCAPLRYYSAGLARWLGQDPLGIAGGLNSHGYVGGNPILLTDSTGGVPDTDSNRGEIVFGPNCNRGSGEGLDIMRDLPPDEKGDVGWHPYPLPTAYDDADGGPISADYFIDKTKRRIVKIRNCMTCTMHCAEDGTPVKLHCERRFDKGKCLVAPFTPPSIKPPRDVIDKDGVAPPLENGDWGGFPITKTFSPAPLTGGAGKIWTGWDIDLTVGTYENGD